MAGKPANLDKWRDYFRTSNSDIFNIIEHAIMVAASDCPKEFKLRRDGIAQTLFSCKLTRCVGCDRIELSVSGGRDNSGHHSGDDDDNDDKDCKNGCEFGAGGSKESKVNSSSRDDQVEMKMNQVSNNYSYGDAEALSDEIEEQNQMVAEVLRIKQILDNSQDESASELYDSLRRLQLMILSVDTLKVTEIGKSVNALRKHESKQICHLARTLIEEWKAVVDEWVSATNAAGTEGTPESVNPSMVDNDEEEEEEGLPSPPMDDGIFFATDPASIDFSDKFFEDMDDDGNVRYSSGGKSKQNRENRRKLSLDNQNRGVTYEKSKAGDEMKKKEKHLRENEASGFVKPHRPTNTVSGPGRPTKVKVEQKEPNKFQQTPDKSNMQKKPPLAAQQVKPKCSDDSARLEAAKRKLQERYQQAENAKRQRTIQVMELHDLPKQQGHGNRNPPAKPGNHVRHRLLARR